MAPTLDDVAKRAGCSSATVSRVLNNIGQVSDQTRAAILKAVSATKYRPRRSDARRAHDRMPGTKLVDVVVLSNMPMERLAIRGPQLEVVEATDSYPVSAILDESNHLSNSFFRFIVDGMVAELARWGCRAVLMPTRNLLDGAFLDDVRGTTAQGILLTGMATPDVDQFLAACDRPVVVVDQEVVRLTSTPVITIDNFAGVAQAFRHLYDLGHRRIAFLAGPDNFAYRERELAYRMQMAGAALAVREQWIYRGANQIEASAAWLRTLLSRRDRPTALVCSNDVLALGAVRAAAEEAVAVPGELSIVGFDDIEPAAAVTPPLTTVHAPMIEMGRQAARQLMLETKLPLGTTSPPARLRLMPELVVRSSTGPCAGAKK